MSDNAGEKRSNKPETASHDLLIPGPSTTRRAFTEDSPDKPVIPSSLRDLQEKSKVEKVAQQMLDKFLAASEKAQQLRRHQTDRAREAKLKNPTEQHKRHRPAGKICTKERGGNQQQKSRSKRHAQKTRLMDGNVATDALHQGLRGEEKVILSKHRNIRRHHRRTDTDKPLELTKEPVIKVDKAEKSNASNANQETKEVPNKDILQTRFAHQEDNIAPLIRLDELSIAQANATARVDYPPARTDFWANRISLCEDESIPALNIYIRKSSEKTQELYREKYEKQAEKSDPNVASLFRSVGIGQLAIKEMVKGDATHTLSASTAIESQKRNKFTSSTQQSLSHRRILKEDVLTCERRSSGKHRRESEVTNTIVPTTLSDVALMQTTPEHTTLTQSSILYPEMHQELLGSTRDAKKSCTKKQRLVRTQDQAGDRRDIHKKINTSITRQKLKLLLAEKTLVGTSHDGNVLVYVSSDESGKHNEEFPQNLQHSRQSLENDPEAFDPTQHNFLEADTPEKEAAANRQKSNADDEQLNLAAEVSAVPGSALKPPDVGATESFPPKTAAEDRRESHVDGDQFNGVADKLSADPGTALKLASDAASPEVLPEKKTAEDRRTSTVGENKRYSADNIPRVPDTAIEPATPKILAESKNAVDQIAPAERETLPKSSQMLLKPNNVLRLSTNELQDRGSIADVTQYLPKQNKQLQGADTQEIPESVEVPHSEAASTITPTSKQSHPLPSQSIIPESSANGTTPNTKDPPAPNIPSDKLSKKSTTDQLNSSQFNIPTTNKVPNNNNSDNNVKLDRQPSVAQIRANREDQNEMQQPAAEVALDKQSPLSDSDAPFYEAEEPSDVYLGELHAGKALDNELDFIRKLKKKRPSIYEHNEYGVYFVEQFSDDDSQFQSAGEYDAPSNRGDERKQPTLAEDHLTLPTVDQLASQDADNIPGRKPSLQVEQRQRNSLVRHESKRPSAVPTDRKTSVAQSFNQKTSAQLHTGERGNNLPEFQPPEEHLKQENSFGESTLHDVTSGNFKSAFDRNRGSKDIASSQQLQPASTKAIVSDTSPGTAADRMTSFCTTPANIREQQTSSAVSDSASRPNKTIASSATVTSQKTTSLGSSTRAGIPSLSSKMITAEALRMQEIVKNAEQTDQGEKQGLERKRITVEEGKETKQALPEVAKLVPNSLDNMGSLFRPKMPSAKFTDQYIMVKHRAVCPPFLLFLLNLCILVLFLLISHFGWLDEFVIHTRRLFPEFYNIRPICDTVHCGVAGTTFFYSVNHTVNPCTDPIGHVCSSWIHRSPSDYQKIVLGAEKRFIDNIFYELRRMLEEPSKIPKGPVAFKKAVALYQACIDMTTRNTVGVTGIRMMLQQYQLGNWPNVAYGSQTYPEYALAKFIRDTGSGTLVSIRIVPDPTDHLKDRRKLIALDCSTFPLPIDTYVKYREKQGTLIQSYEALIYNVTSQYVQGNIDANIAKNILAFEVNTANRCTRECRRKKFRRMLLGDFIRQSHLAGYGRPIDWIQFIRIVFETVQYPVDETTEVLVRSPSYFRKMTALLRDQQGSARANLYIGWRILNHFQRFTTPKMLQLYANFQEKILGNPPMETWMRCVIDVNSVMPLAIGRLYVDYMLWRSSDYQVHKIVFKLIQSLDILLWQLRWIEGHAFDLAQHTLTSSGILVGYPPWIQSNAALDTYYEAMADRGQLLYLTWSASRVHTQNYMKEILIAVYTRRLFNFIVPHKSVEFMHKTGPPRENLLYDMRYNQFVVPAGVFQPPYYTYQAVSSLNLGGLGMLVGLDLITEFFRSPDSLWLNQQLKEIYSKRQDCLHTAIEHALGKPIGGEKGSCNMLATFTLTLRLAYSAYHEFLEHNDEPTIPNMEKYTPDQLFFLSAIRSLCTRIRETHYVPIVMLKEEVPEISLLTATVASMNEFSDAFRCKVADRKNVLDRCLFRTSSWIRDKDRLGIDEYQTPLEYTEHTGYFGFRGRRGGVTKILNEETFPTEVFSTNKTMHKRLPKKKPSTTHKAYTTEKTDATERHRARARTHFPTKSIPPGKRKTAAQSSTPTAISTITTTTPYLKEILPRHLQKFIDFRHKAASTTVSDTDEKEETTVLPPTSRETTSIVTDIGFRTPVDFRKWFMLSPTTKRRRSKAPLRRRQNDQRRLQTRRWQTYEIEDDFTEANDMDEHGKNRDNNQDYKATDAAESFIEDDDNKPRKRIRGGRLPLHGRRRPKTRTTTDVYEEVLF